jgi:hypothetical protein
MELKKYITKNVKYLNAIKLEEENFNEVTNLVNGVKKYYTDSDSYYLSYVSTYDNISYNHVVHVGDYIIKDDNYFYSMFGFCFEDKFEEPK